MVRRGSFFGEHRRQAFTSAPAGRGNRPAPRVQRCEGCRGWRGAQGTARIAKARSLLDAGELSGRVNRFNRAAVVPADRAGRQRSDVLIFCNRSVSVTSA